MVQRTDDVSPEGRVTDRVLTAIAEKTGTDPMEFDRPLYEVVDPDALDTLFQRNGSAKTVEFVYLGHQVRVFGDGEVAVADADA